MGGVAGRSTRSLDSIMGSATRKRVAAIGLVIGAVAGWGAYSGLLNELPFQIFFSVVALCITAITIAVVAGLGSNARALRLTIRVGAALILGILSLFPVGSLFDEMKWPLFHSWALGHGSFVVAIPAAASVAYVILGAVPWLRPKSNDAV